jgi:hypothetical protein
MTTVARWLIAASLAAALCAAPLRAQEAAAPEAPAAEASALSAEALDALVAPVALYPDALLAQVLVAATYPLELVKAARWTAANADTAGDARADAAEAEGWDASVTVLAAGFPSVVERMADEIDWTEALGDAVIAQTDDVMDAVQRQRARAAALGNLESNAAQTVTLENDAISVAPADPEVIYVPAYDPALAYTQPATAAPLVVTDPADTGYSSGELLATGAIAFGAGMLVNELFDEDDDWGGGYWGGPPRFDWDDGGFYPRPGVDIDGDVTINVDRERIDFDRGERFQPGDDRVAEARDRISQRDGGGGLRERAEAQGGADREAARERIAARRDDGARPARPAGGGDRAAATEKLRARGDGGGAALRRDGDGPLAAKRAETRGAASKGGGLKAAAQSKGGGGALHRPAGDRPRAGAGDRPRPKAGGGGRGEAMKRAGGRDHAARAGDRGGLKRR